MRPTKRFLLAALVLGTALGGGLSCERKPPQPRRQAILFLLDAARPDRFSCYGYERETTPEMDRLAERGVVFLQHFAQGTGTRVSLSSLLPSRFYALPLFPNSRQVPYSDPSHLFRAPDDEQISFVKVLESAGLKTAAISAHKWTGADTAFATEFSEMHDLVDRFSRPGRSYPDADKVVDYTIEWIRKNKDRDYFLYVHLMDTHLPHFFEADAQAFFGATVYTGGAFGPAGRMLKPDTELSDVDRRYADALYDGSMRYTDRHIGRLAEFLRSERLLDNTLIAITADHGEHMFDLPGGRTREGLPVFRHGGEWYDAVAKIPLIIHYPRGLKPRQFDHFSEGVDVGPTLLSLLDVAVPAGKSFDGIDLVQVIEGNVPPKEHVVSQRGIRTDQYKCLFSESDTILLGTATPAAQNLHGELYALLADPAETTNVFASRPGVVAELLDRYRSSMTFPFRRFMAARTTHQPRSEFAISAAFMDSDVELPVITQDSGAPPAGWARLKRGTETALLASNTDEPLSIQFPLPDGRYLLFVKMVGHATFDVGGVRRELSHKGLVEFGEILVTDEVFRATLEPRAGQTLGLSYFGFVPASAGDQDPDAAAKQMERLRELGYIE